MGGIGSDFSQVLNLTLKDVEQQLGATEEQLKTMDMEEILKQLYASSTLETLPSFMRAPSWQQQQQQAGPDPTPGKAPNGTSAPAAPILAPTTSSWETAAANASAAAAQQRQQAAAAAAAQQQQQQQQAQPGASGALSLAAQLQGAGLLPLSSLRMDQVFSWYAENQAQTKAPQMPLSSMTLSQLFDTAGLQLAPPGAAPPAHQGPSVMLGTQSHQQQQMQQGTGLLGLPVSTGPPSTSLQHMASLHLHAAANRLPPGLSINGPFASDTSSLPASLPVMEATLLPPQSLPPPQSLQPSTAPQAAPGAGQPKNNAAAAAARAARARKRKDMALASGGAAGGPPGGPPGAQAAKLAGGLTAAEAARQAREVAERAAAELAELPPDLSDKEAKQIKRAIKNRESAARSRAKRQEYTATLEQQVEQLKQQNIALRQQVIQAAAAPPDPRSKFDGELMRRSRTGPI